MTMTSPSTPPPPPPLQPNGGEQHEPTSDRDVPPRGRPLLLVDSRERALLSEMKSLLQDSSSGSTNRDDRRDDDSDDDVFFGSAAAAAAAAGDMALSFHPSPSLPWPVASPLDLGDVQFVDDDVILVAIERKTVADLCASIKDGRYREQKHRLRGCVAGRGGRVLYVVEGHQGGFANLASAARAHGLAPGTLKTCVYGLAVAAGIPVLFTRDLRDTAHAVLELWQRHWHASYVSGQKQGAEDNERASGQEERQSTAALIASGISAKRSANLTPQTCYLLQLCQIPGVSMRTARVLASRWPSMAALYAELSPLDETGRRRALGALDTIGKKGAQVIADHLFYDGGAPTLPTPAAD